METEWPMPPVTEWSSLNDCLHDATLKAVIFDRGERCLQMKVLLGFPSPPEPFPDEVYLRFHEVGRLLFFVHSDEPENIPKHSRGMSTAEWEELVRQHQAKAVSLTVGVSEFGELCASEGVEVIETRWSAGPQGVVLELQGFAERYSWYRLVVAATSLEIVAGERSVSLDELLSVGRSGWQAM